jgi:hypothetical protein
MRKDHSVSYWKVGGGESGKVRGGKCKVQNLECKMQSDLAVEVTQSVAPLELGRGKGIFLKGRIREALPFRTEDFADLSSLIEASACNYVAPPARRECS